MPATNLGSRRHGLHGPHGRRRAAARRRPRRCSPARAARAPCGVPRRARDLGAAAPAGNQPSPERVSSNWSSWTASHVEREASPTPSGGSAAGRSQSLPVSFEVEDRVRGIAFVLTPRGGGARPSVGGAARRSPAFARSPEARRILRPDEGLEACRRAARAGGGGRPGGTAPIVRAPRRGGARGKRTMCSTSY